MSLQLDHLILAVNDREKSIAFYERVLGMACEGERAPFTVMRVTPELVLQLAPWGTKGGQHLAFSTSRAEFDEIFRRIREAGLAYGDSFHAARNMQGPGEEAGARGSGKALYLFDPNEHLIEIRHYEA